jgi:hypothetical protein
MPAPNRLPPIVIESEAHSFTKGIVGYYTDLEVDALVAALAGGGGGGLQTVDLSAYATTAYVDGKLATVYTKAEVDAAIAAAATGDVDLSAYALAADVATLQQGVTDANAGVQSVADSITFVAEELGKQLNAKIDTKAEQATTYTKAEVDAALANVATGGTVDLAAYATTAYVDGVASGKADQSEFSAFQGQFGTQEAEFREYFRLLNQGFATVAQKPDVDAALELKADKAETYTKLEVDAAIAGIVTGDLSQEQIDAIISQVGPVDLTAYAKSEDVYAKTESDTKYATKEATTLLVTQLQAVFDSIYTRPEADDRYAAKSDNAQQLLTKTIVAQGFGFGFSPVPSAALNYADSGDGYGERLILNVGASKEYLVYKSDLDELFPAIDTSQFSTTVTVAAIDTRVKSLESKAIDTSQFSTTATVAAIDTRVKSLESKAAATSNINDATNAALKKSILDAVALMLAGGGRQPPADIGWTACRNFGSGDHPTAQARMIGGVIELRGTLSYPSGTTGDQSFCRLPAGFPFAELNASIPAAAKVTSGSVAVAAYVTFSSLSANLGFDTASRANEVFLTGIKVKAAY